AAAAVRDHREAVLAAVHRLAESQSPEINRALRNFLHAVWQSDISRGRAFDLMAEVIPPYRPSDWPCEFAGWILASSQLGTSAEDDFLERMPAVLACQPLPDGLSDLVAGYLSRFSFRRASTPEGKQSLTRIHTCSALPQQQHELARAFLL